MATDRDLRSRNPLPAGPLPASPQPNGHVSSGHVSNGHLPRRPPPGSTPPGNLPARHTSRRAFLGQSAVLAGAAFLVPRFARAERPSAEQLAFAGVRELGHYQARGVLGAVDLAQSCLERIQQLDRQGPALRAMIELNPDALAIARERDAERQAGRVRGPLHGIPIVVKDNVDSADRMRTSAGSLLLQGSSAPRDAFILERARAAGAVLIGKTNLSEWANFRSTRSTSGWSARGGLSKNPHVLDRNTSGSSSGTASAIAAGLAPIGIGTETDGSIISPSSICGIVGIKPTLGLWGRSGIIPIAASQDTGGPMARSVADAAALLGPLTGIDPRDAATQQSHDQRQLDYLKYLKPAGLKGARIGVARNLAGFHSAVDQALEAAIAALRSAGARIVDDLTLAGAGQFDDAELEVLLYEFNAALPAYLMTRGAAVKARSLADVIEFNERERTQELAWFGQELFERARAKGPLSEPAYRTAREHCTRLTRSEGLDPLFAKHSLDAVICPSNSPAWVTDFVNGDHWLGGNTSFAAVAGYPSLTVPMGFTHSLPLGLSFIGKPWSEGKLIELGYAFERSTGAWHPPRFLPTLLA